MLPGSSEERKLGFFEQCGALCVGLVSLFAAFELMLQLRDILEPLIFSAFMVAAIEKPVEHVYKILTSCHLTPCARRRQSTDNTEAAEEEGEAQPLQAAHRLSAPQQAVEDLRLVEECHGCLRIIAVLIVLSAISLGLFGLGVMVWYNCMQMKEEWPAYKAGALRVAGSFQKLIDTIGRNLNLQSRTDVDHYVKASYEKLLTATEQLIWGLLNKVLENVSQGLSWLILTFLYTFFWLLRPLPLTDQMNEFIRSYILKKTIICLGYGLCVGILFGILHIDLAAVFGLASFALSYLPEVGPIIAICLPIPVILLDGRLKNPLATLCAATLGQLLLKFVFGNYLEVKLIEDDRMMMIHPVWILLGLTYFGYVWGPVGMLLSVPILAMFKVLVIPETGVVPKGYGLPILACLEGRLSKKAESQRA